MSKTVLAKFTVLFFFVGVLTAGTANAQTTSCGLMLDVSVLDSDVLVKGATATAKNVETKRIYRSTMKDGFPFFAKLPEGDYSLSITRTGYKKTVDSYEVSCVLAEEGVVTTGVEMVKGSPTQTYTVTGRNAMAIRAGEKFKIGSVNVNSGEGVARIEPNEQTKSDKSSNGGSRVVPKIINKGVVNGSAVSLPAPPYPPAARAVRADGIVSVRVTIDEDGNVISATAVGGHPLLQQAAVTAARKARFRPTLLSGTPVKVTGIITYNFVAQ